MRIHVDEQLRLEIVRQNFSPPISRSMIPLINNKRYKIFEVKNMS